MAKTQPTADFLLQTASLLCFLIRCCDWQLTTPMLYGIYRTIYEYNYTIQPQSLETKHLCRYLKKLHYGVTYRKQIRCTIKANLYSVIYTQSVTVKNQFYLLNKSDSESNKNGLLTFKKHRHSCTIKHLFKCVPIAYT